MIRPLVLLLICPTIAMAAEPTEVIKLWPGTPPGPAREVGEEADTSGPDGRRVAGRSVIRLGNVSSPEAHVFLPPADKRNGSAVVVCPGGGYNILAWDLEGLEVAEWLNSIGVTAIVLKYRVPTGKVDPKWLQPVQDAQRTISIVRSKADAWKLDANRIGILGFSAGGHTAAMTSLAGKRHYETIDAADEQSCTPNAAILIYPAYLSNKENTSLSDGLVVTESSPTTFIVHAFDDGVPVQGSLLLMMALKNAKVPSELHVYDTGGHGYGLRPVADRPVTSWPDRCHEWLKRNGWAK
ncbi:MAG: alpha/beta hydrolase [Planctomycetaceae bacterium]